MKNLFESDTYNTILKRIANLSPESTAQWGKMNVGQMLNHCQKPIEIALYNKDFGLKSNFLIRTFFKKSMYDDSALRKNMPTPKGFKVAEPKDFSTEKERLKSLIKSFHSLKNKKDWTPHPVFGNLTPEQWSKMQYKHLDHHFRQFGV
ncbi:DUF1569 domain-containing protein [Leeuwenhoekiella marinoflava]|uniref:DUF1569 domain-containing protein n=2 Tax=Leeuwenhoekiella marinoflava TaxID=988 RepID=A0A4Q0PJR2_9FLAO|nr:DUF1569 domain-containing protein [Leeuwenhoekiella marinoflava]RXG27908.1 putative protein DUF1569 [Leeuwenhoekiella marinoflava]SHF61704.1 Protein of unknown function [Leeuwenhoekiella marinoflava DSM 3653]